MAIGALRSGVAPDSVLPTAANAAAELTTVEASDLSVVAGSARIIVRFTADDAAAAVRIGRHVVTATQVVAEPLSSAVTERVKGHWDVVR